VEGSAKIYAGQKETEESNDKTKNAKAEDDLGGHLTLRE